MPQRGGLPQVRLPRTKNSSRAQEDWRAIIYFGTDSTTLLASMNETAADVIGLDWRIPLNDGWALMKDRPPFRQS